TTVIAFFVGNSLMFIFGAIGAMITGKSDISEVLLLQGLIIPAIIILGFNIWTTNDNALYASGLGFANITKIAKKKLVIFNGLIGTIFAMWLYNNFIGWLSFLSIALPAIGAIIISDYFIVNKCNYKRYEEAIFVNINWIAITAWISGFLAAKFIPGIPPLNGIIVASSVYIIVSKVKVWLK
ncbi:MAG: cytosine permease, partial [Pseudomonadota bacterium]